MPPTESESIRCADTVTLSDKVAFLKAPASYLPPPGRVDVVETHMAWVFLAGELAFKLKKPVRYPFLDFSTCEMREQVCREEVRLNRRLAPETYLGAVPITLGTDGRLAIDGSGTVIDWLVKMRRLPDEKMLDRAIGAGAAGPAEIGSLSEVLCRFYANATPMGISGPDYVSHFAREHATNRDVLTDKRFELDPETRDGVLSAIDRFLRQRQDLIAERSLQGRIVEGHGDLRPEHVCLIEPPVVIDCLEFNRQLRAVDPFDELAFLGLECDLLGASWIGQSLIEACSKKLGDRPPAALLAFYTAYRASLRARLTLRHLLEPDPRDPPKWLPLARRYLDLAARACVNLRLR